TLKWKFAIADQIRCSPTIVENRAFVAGCDSKLHIIDLDSGKETATVEIQSPTGVTPAVLGDRVYFGTESATFFGIDWRKAEVVWSYQPDKGSQPFRSSPAVTKECIIFGGRNKRVQALDPQDGKELWSFTAKNRLDSSPVIVGDRAFIGSADGRLYALNTKTGEKVWQYEAGGGFAGSAAVSNERLVIANDNGTVYCFGKKD
ncbi:MAG TPA: PQQ-like beta-propeller repeat protein, partial [Pirellulaceae bacterium]|nr:PQQ-like beta-propeller repeat protein [Pirellulaceae bacterium]